MAKTRSDESQSAFDGVIVPDEKAASDAEAALSRAQSAADTLSSVVRDTRYVGGRRPSLDEVDAELAEGADDVIESVFASVEELLGDSFDEDERRTEQSEEVEAAATDTSAAMEEDADDGGMPAPAADALPADGDDGEILRSGGEVNEDLSHSSDAEQHDETAAPSTQEIPDAPAQEELETHEVASTILNADLSEATSDAISRMESEQLMESGSAATKVKSAASRADLLMRLLEAIASWLKEVAEPKRALRIAITALNLLALPLRLIPEGARPYVDWIALSLVFWIPVIWVVVLYVLK